MNVENSMVVGAKEQYERANREPTVCERRKYTSDRARFLTRLLSGQPATATNGITFDLGDVWDLMPPDFLTEYRDTETVTINQLFLTGKLGKWAQATQIAAGKLADHAGFEE